MKQTKLKINIPQGTKIYFTLPTLREVIADKDQVIEVSEASVGYGTTEIRWHVGKVYEKYVNVVDILVANPELHALMIKKTDEYLAFLA